MLFPFVFDIVTANVYDCKRYNANFAAPVSAPERGHELAVNAIDKYNLTEGGIVRKLFSVAAPLILTSVFQMAYNLTDMFWLGRLSSYAVAATGTVGLFLWMGMAFLMFGRMGAEIGVSQNFGRGDRARAFDFAQNAIIISLITGIIIMVVFFLAQRPLIGIFRIQEENVAQYARDYLAIVSLSAPTSFVSAAIMGVFNGAGNSRVSLAIGGLGFAINMILTPILIFSAGLGVIGAAYATVIAHAFGTAFALVLLKKFKERPFENFKVFTPVKKSVVKQIFVWVTPISAESFLFTSLTMIVNILIVSFGANAMAAARVSSQVESLTWLIGGGFASAMTAFAGQNYGSRKWTRITQGFKYSSAIMSLWGLFVSILLIFAGRFLIGLFIHDSPEIVEIGAMNLRILAIAQIPQSLEGIAAGVFRGQGKTLPPSISNVTSNVFRVILAFALVHFTSLGLNGVWLALAIGSTFRGIWIYMWYVFYQRKLPKTDGII